MPTIDSVLARSAAAAPDRVAIHDWDDKRKMSYGELDAAVSSFAAWSRLNGLAEGDVIALHLPNSRHFIIGQFGSFRAGAVAAYVNYRLSVTEATRQIRLCKARMVVTTAAKAREFLQDEAFGDTVFITVGASDGGADEAPDDTVDGCHSLRQIVEAKLKPTHATEGREDCDALIRFTSGSTGEPKGLIVTHTAWLLRAVSMLAEEMKIAPHSTTLVLGPLSHQAGLFVIPTFLQCGTLLLVSKFDLGSIADVFATQRVSLAQIVPTMFSLIMDDPKAREAFRQSGIERIVYGGSPIRQSLLEEVLALLPDTDFVQGYGSHETGSITHLDGHGHRSPELRSSAGTPFLAVQMRLRKAKGESIGEIEVKAPWLPHARLTEQGREPIAGQWSRTGDLGEMIGGYLFLRDRMNDVIISGGFNVYPTEVEKAINSHPEVLDSAVASAPDDKWGERVVAFIVPRIASAFDEDSLRAHCKTLLASYKIPKEFRMVNGVPLNATGKPDRRQLSQPMWEGRKRRIN